MGCGRRAVARCRALARGRRRRHGGLPAELWALRPGRNLHVSPGIGQAAAADSGALASLFEDVLVRARRWSWIPPAGTRSWGAVGQEKWEGRCEDEASHPSRESGRLCLGGRELCRRGEVYEPPWAYGSLLGRTREPAITTMLAVACPLRRAKRDHVYDEVCS